LAIAIAVREFATLLGAEPVAAFDVGCFPWHGFAELSLLTAAELDANPALLDSREVAAWRYYNFSSGMASWDAAAQLGRLMSKAYYSAADSTKAINAEAFMRSCAVAVSSPEVGAALDSLTRDSRFRVMS
jgi:hypothetical protein